MLIVESKGWPIGVNIFPAHRHEPSLVEETLEYALKWVGMPKNMIGDGAYSSQPLSERLLRDHDICLTAPPKKHYVNFFHDGRKLRRLKRRWQVERCFAWIKHHRRIHCRWDFYPENYLGFVHLACIKILLTLV